MKYSLSQKDVQAIQSIGSKKSINQFSSAEIESTRTMAEILYRDIKEKSTFFRAWFGDWRQYDTTPIVIADKKGNISGSIINNDTGWSIQVSRKVFNETESHKGRINASAMSYLDYVNNIVKNAVLLDTFAMDKNKSENSLFMHSFYTLADIGNGPELIKLYVEEMNDPNGEKTSKRAYQLQNIEKQQVAVTGSQISSASRISQPTVRYTVSDLFTIVKSKDNNFKPNNVNPAFLNEDGTPKVFYRGTKADFTVFDREKRTKKVSLNVMGDRYYFTKKRQRAERYGRMSLNHISR